VFYFGILTDDTPPVGPAAFAPAPLSGGDPLKTGVQGFMYDIRTALLPFLFIFNTELLLIDVTVWKAFFVFAVAVVAMMLFAAATQGYFFTRNRWWETIALLLVAFTLFRPGYWLDQVSPPFAVSPGTELNRVLDAAAPSDEIRVRIQGPNYDNPDETSETSIVFEAGEGATAVERLKAVGLVAARQGDVVAIEEPMFGTRFESIGRTFDFYGDAPVTVAEVKLPVDRWPKEIFYIPALLLLGLVIALQRRRQTVPAF